MVRGFQNRVSGYEFMNYEGMDWASIHSFAGHAVLRELWGQNLLLCYMLHGL